MVTCLLNEAISRIEQKHKCKASCVKRPFSILFSWVLMLY